MPDPVSSKGILSNVIFLETKRPWLSIYGTRIRPVQPVGSSSRLSLHDSALLHRALPDELLFEVFIRMAPYTLGRASCVCRKWRYALRTPVLWRNACLKAWQLYGLEENKRILWESYGGSWRKMWQLRPRLRSDGLYVSRNTYVRAGIAEWKITNPVHLVCYYRYIRFYPGGKFLYKSIDGDIPPAWQRTTARKQGSSPELVKVLGKLHCKSWDPIYDSISSLKKSGYSNSERVGKQGRGLDFEPIAFLRRETSPLRLKEVAKSIHGKPSKADAVFGGRYTVLHDQVEAAILYPGLRPTVLRIRLRIRSTTPGANNRLDLLALVTCGVGEGGLSMSSEDVLNVVEGWEENETRDPDVPAVSHRRGMAAFVFVPFEEVDTSVLNLPVDKMDYYVPG